MPGVNEFGARRPDRRGALGASPYITGKLAENSLKTVGSVWYNYH